MAMCWCVYTYIVARSYGSVLMCIHVRCGQVVWQCVQVAAQGDGAGAGHQAGSCGHWPPGDHQGDLHHAAVRQQVHCQILWQLLQKHRPMGKWLRVSCVFARVCACTCVCVGGWGVNVGRRLAACHHCATRNILLERMYCSSDCTQTWSFSECLLVFKCLCTCHLCVCECLLVLKCLCTCYLCVCECLLVLKCLCTCHLCVCVCVCVCVCAMCVCVEWRERVASFNASNFAAMTSPRSFYCRPVDISEVHILHICVKTGLWGEKSVSK